MVAFTVTRKGKSSHRSLIDKLGVKRGQRIAAINVDNAGFLSVLTETAGAKPAKSLRGTYDMIFLQVDDRKDLLRIPVAAEHLADAGALWVLHPKGKDATVKDAEVREVYLACGLVDNKISAYTETHTATRCVVPLARRGRT